MPSKTGQVQVWDLPTRLFHWLLVIALLACFVTGQLGGAWMDWHGRSGLAIVGLIAFRLAWGIVGSPTARFSQFVRGPRALREYFKGQWRGIGHSPLGAIAALVLLAVVAVQVGSGLFANDDIAYQGPLADFVGKEASDRLRAWHGTLFYVLAAFVVLHVAAIVFYLRIKRDNLIRPMVTGWKPVTAELAPAAPRVGGTRVAALLLSVVVAGVAVYAADGGFTPPPPTPVAAAPAW